MEVVTHRQRLSAATMLQKPQNHLSFLSTRSSFNSRPLSEATEILDTDVEAEYSDEYDSPRRSIESLENDSLTTLSTPDELPTPDALENKHFDLRLGSGKPVEGPSGPHLFRSSLGSSLTGRSDEYEWNFPDSPVSEEEYRNPTTVAPEWVSGPTVPPKVRPASSMSVSRPSPRQSVSDVRAWSPAQVAEWMYETGLEDMVVERFIQNDISGAVLLDLQIEDLKELDIQSFGKRHSLMNMIQALRSEGPPLPEKIPLSASPRLSRSTSLRRSNSRTQTPLSPDCDPQSPKLYGRRNRIVSQRDVILPSESVSIVAIEQLIPKPHKCSKGENCPKFLKRQRKLARIAKEFPDEFGQANDRLVPIKERSSTFRPKSDAAPSLVASSDVLGPSQMPELKLNAENLNGVHSRDPQENVRQFLSFQHVDPSKDDSYVDQQQLEMFPPLSPPNPSATEHMSNQLRNLPKLVIPGQSQPHYPLSPERTITPSMGQRQIGSATATQEYNPYAFGQDVYRQVTPFSEMDAPLTALPLEPLDRETSQSVPPNMRFGNFLYPSAEPITRSQSIRPDHHRRRPSLAGTMTVLEENEVLQPINRLSEFRPTFQPQQSSAPQTANIESSSTSASSLPKNTDAAHSGWMKKRKTRLLRHEWQDAHFTLKGTVLAMHKDERDSRSLETIDVDDYAVACSSLASNSKLTAAFKRSLLRKAASVSTNGSGMDESAFAFSLVPSSTAEKKTLPIFPTLGKSHHFAVKSRDDRINWMRELMLAKALKKGKEGGDQMTVNGNVI